MVAFKLRTSLSEKNIMNFLIFTLRARRPDQRGTRKAVGIHASGTKRVETWRGGRRWCELVIGGAVASGGETETGKED